MDIKAIVNELNKLQELLNERVKLKEDIRLLRIENSKLKDELVYQKNKQEPLPEWVLNSSLLLTFSTVSKDIFEFEKITGRQKLFDILRQKKVLGVDNVPEPRFSNLGYFKIRGLRIPNTKRFCNQTCFTPVGVIAMYDFLIESGFVTKLSIQDILFKLERCERHRGDCSEQ